MFFCYHTLLSVILPSQIGGVDFLELMEMHDRNHGSTAGYFEREGQRADEACMDDVQRSIY